MAVFGISVQDLVERFSLSHYQLDATTGHEHLMSISLVIDDHELLGTELGFRSVDMTAISLERTQQLQMSTLLRKWKQRFAWKAMYLRLIEALLKCERADLAVEVCGLLTQSYQHEKESPSSVPPACSDAKVEQSPGHIVDAAEVFQPDLGQLEVEATFQLRQNVKIMEKKFEDLVIAAYRHLEKRQVPVHKIRQSPGHVSNLRRISHQQEIQEAGTVADLFEVLTIRRCWLDFLNPRLLKTIIECHFSESSDIQYRKREYLEELQVFRKATTARQFAKGCNVSILHPKFSEAIIQLGDNATLEDLENFEPKASGTRISLV